MMITRKHSIRTLIKIIRPTLDSRYAFNINHNDGLTINDKKWNGYNEFRIDDSEDWLIQKVFIGMENHCNTLFNGIRTLELILN